MYTVKEIYERVSDVLDGTSITIEDINVNPNIQFPSPYFLSEGERYDKGSYLGETTLRFKGEKIYIYIFESKKVNHPIYFANLSSQVGDISLKDLIKSWLEYQMQKLATPYRQYVEFQLQFRKLERME